MPIKKYETVLKDLELFSGISESERSSLLQKGKLLKIPRGKYLFRTGTLVDHFYILCSGSMQLTRETPVGKEITTAVKLSGRTIGKREILNALKTHTVNACALTDAVVLSFPADWLRQIASHPVISLNILSAVSRYAYMVEIEAEHKSTMSVAQRIGCFMQRLCVMHDFDPRGFELPYSKLLIASRLGVEPETLSRALSALRTHGLNITHTNVTIDDMDALGHFVCEHCSMVGECETHKKLSYVH